MWTAKEFFKKLHVVIACCYFFFLIYVCFTDFPKKGFWNGLFGSTTSIYAEKGVFVVLNFLVGALSLLFLKDFSKKTLIVFLIELPVKLILLGGGFVVSNKTIINFPDWVHTYHICFLVGLIILSLINWIVIKFNSSNKRKK